LAVQHGFAEAAARGVGLLVVWAYGPADGPQVSVPTGLEGQTGALRDRYPHVAVTTRLSPVTAAHALMVASHDAQLIVAGSKGHGGMANLVLGCVAQQLL